MTERIGYNTGVELIVAVGFLVFQILFAIFFLFLCLAFVTGGPFVPSNRKSVGAMIALARITKDMTVIDVGSGDGRVLFAAAKAGALAIGVEINPYLVWFTRIRAAVGPYKGRVRAVWSDLWKYDLSGADVVFVYLIPWRMEELASKLKRELKPNATVVTNSFIFPGWKRVREDAAHHVYAYKIEK